MICCDNFTVSGLRSPIDETKTEVILFLFIVDIKTSTDLILEVLRDQAGVVLDLDLPHPGNTQQHILIVDERPVSVVQGLVVVPSRPVKAI